MACFIQPLIGDDVMLKIRPAEERGHANYGWLDTHYTFSFADYYDPANMGFRSLRVINEDFVAPGRGFGTHPHNNMEIVTCVLEGALEHRDSMGSGGIIKPGELQRMSAGTGVTHSEFNPSEQERTHLLQIWILPERRGIAPSYEQKNFDETARKGKLQLVASPDAREGSLLIHQDVNLYLSQLANGQHISHFSAPGRHAWVQVAKGGIMLNGAELKAGDGAAVTGENQIEITGNGNGKASEILLFDLA
jgi:redox-sensitive bicupin YhaK (pirin superfamily)